MASPWKELHLDELFFALAAGYAAHWLITPITHPQATTLQFAWAWTQLIGGIGIYLFLAMRRGGRETQKAG